MGLDILSFGAAGVRRCRAYRLVQTLTAEVTSLKLALEHPLRLEGVLRRAHYVDVHLLSDLGPV